MNRKVRSMGQLVQFSSILKVAKLSPFFRSVLLVSCGSLLVPFAVDDVAANCFNSHPQSEVRIDWRENKESGVAFQFGADIFVPNWPTHRHIFIYVEREHFNATDLDKVFRYISAKYMRPAYLFITARDDRSTLIDVIQCYHRFYTIPRDRGRLSDGERLDSDLVESHSKKATLYADYSRSDQHEDFYYLSDLASQKPTRVHISSNPPDVATNDPLSDLVRACEAGLELQVVKLLRKGTEINARTIHGDTPLAIASSHGHRKIVGLLLGAGADVNLSDFDGGSPLMHALVIGSDEIALDLLKRGASVNARNNYGDTVLILATIRSSVKMIADLIRRGADTEQMDRYGRTPLMIAEESREEEIVTLLKQAGVKK